MKFFLSAFFLLCFSWGIAQTSALAQPTESQKSWVDMMQDPNEQFDKTIEKFEAWKRDHSGIKGSAMKRFHRWKYYMERRVGADGKQNGPQKNYKLFEAFKKREAGKRSSSSETPSWTEVGPNAVPNNSLGAPTGVGRVNCVAFHPTNSQIIFAGAPSGGILKSVDYGANWSNISGNLTRLGVSSIVVDPSNPDLIYIGSGDRDAGQAPGLGVWRTTDGGVNWEAWHTGMGNQVVNEILMDPNDSDILIATTNGHIYRSIDAGLTWTQSNGATQNKDIAFHPTNSNIIYASGKNFYRSTDNGVSWVQVTNGAPTVNGGFSRIAIATTISNPDAVYLISGKGVGLPGDGFTGFYESLDQGVSFTTKSTSPNICGYGATGTGDASQAWYDLVAIGDPNNDQHFIIGAINIWETFNAGVTWSIVSHWTYSTSHPAVHADQHALERSPLTGDLFAGHDGGLHVTSDGGNSFTELSDGMGISQIYKIGQNSISGGHTVAGFQDNGSSIFDGSEWTTRSGGDGMECIVDYENSNVVYICNPFGDIQRSLNGGHNFTAISWTNGTLPSSGDWVTPYKLDPQNPDTMYAGMKNLWRTYNSKSGGTPVWTQISTFPDAAKEITDFDVSKSDGNWIYVSRKGGYFYRCENALSASPTWTILTSNLPAQGVASDIEIHPTDPNVLWIALGTNIYKSTDAGNSWVDISNNLPNITINSIVCDITKDIDAIYVGLDVGVYYLDNTLTEWQSFFTDLPNTEVLELEIYYDQECGGNSKLMAGTFGRGVWSTSLYHPASSQGPETCFSASTTKACAPAFVNLYDQSSADPTSWSWTISPGTHNFVNGTSQSSQNPQVELTVAGTYTIELVASNSNGSTQLIKEDFITVTSGFGLPFTEDFEGFQLCSTAENCSETVCTLTNGWCNEPNGISDDADFRTNMGSTPTPGTGPNIDSNPGTALGKYLYVEGSNCFGGVAHLISPCVDLSTVEEAYFNFDYHMFGGNIGELHLDVLSNGNWITDVVSPIVGSQSNQGWFSRSFSLENYIDEIVTFRFRAILGPGNYSDIAIDNIEITTNPIPPYCDVLETLPYNYDFEDLALCGSATTPCGQTVCPLANGWVNSENGVLDNIDFRPHSHYTPSGGTGAFNDTNPGTSSGIYLYTEATGCSESVAELVSPCFDLRGVPSSSFIFDYYMRGGTMGSLSVDILVGGVWISNIMPTISGNQGNAWHQKVISLDEYAENVVKFRIRAVTGFDQSDITIDNITLCEEFGTACDDGNECTINDKIKAPDCGCVGTFMDSDGDGVCDANDICVGGNDAQDIDGDGIPDFCDPCNDLSIGTACDDGNPCTYDDIIDINCLCNGTYQDSNEDGTCDYGSLLPVADSYIRGGGGQNVNYGTLPYIIIKNSTPGYTREGFLRFDLSAVSGTVESCTLKLFNGGGGGNWNLHHVPIDDWIETVITYNNSPAAGDFVGNAAAGANSFVEWDVSDIFSSELEGDQLLSFKITGTNSSLYTSFPSRESADVNQKPVLIVNYVPSPDNEAPSVPTQLTANNTGVSSTDLSWGASTDDNYLAGYEIFQYGLSIGTTTATYYSVIGLNASTTYSYTVRAYDAADNYSAHSNSVSVTTHDLLNTATWFGTHDSSWFNSQNWENNLLPNEDSDIIVKLGIHNPKIYQTVVARSILLENGSELLLGTGGHLEISP